MIYVDNHYIFLINEASSPAVTAPINAAAAAGIAVKSTSSRRSVIGNSTNNSSGCRHWNRAVKHN